MSRNPYELEMMVRYQLDEMATLRRTTARVGATRLAGERLSRWLGLALIRLGARLAGPDALGSIARRGGLDRAPACP
jgi:hypothetical protein